MNIIGSLSVRQIHWTIDVKAAILFGLFFLLFLTLGVWQLDRAADKRAISQQKLQYAQFEPIDLLSLKHTPAEFQSVSLKGEFDIHNIWFLKNQIIKGEYGYDLLIPFNTVQGETLLVNLGWVDGTSSRPPEINHNQLMPLLDMPSIFGNARKPMNLPFVENIFQNVGNDSILEITPESFPYSGMESSWYLQISPDHPAALRTHWQDKSIKASKHIGYAIQWFAMAITLAFAFLLTNSDLAQRWQRGNNK